MSEGHALQGGWKRLRGRLFHTWFLLSRPMTLGVRGIVHDAGAGTVLLIRHTYVPGWQLPGGGIEPGETALEALRRELEEEANIRLTGAPQLRSFHFNRHASRRDHVALYLVNAYEQLGEKVPDHEIEEARFFSLSNLPDGITPATRQRLAEIFNGNDPSEHW
jgi:8-oxo-dGTP pyrophosphatase MutT (NUDIX family)